MLVLCRSRGKEGESFCRGTDLSGLTLCWLQVDDAASMAKSAIGFEILEKQDVVALLRTELLFIGMNQIYVRAVRLLPLSENYRPPMVGWPIMASNICSL